MNRLLGARAGWRWVHLILGGALLMPYFLLAQVVVGVVAGGVNALDSAPLSFLAYALSLPLVAATALFGPVRPMSVVAVRAMCGVPGEGLADGPARSWAARGRASAWWTLHLGTGALISGMTLAVPPMAVALIAVPVVGRLRDVRLGYGWFATDTNPYAAPWSGSVCWPGWPCAPPGPGSCWPGRRPCCSGRRRRTGWPRPRSGPPTWQCATGWPGNCTTRSGTR